MSPCTLFHCAALLHGILLFAVCEEGSGKNINFHNIRPPVDATPFPGSFKCFTCEHAPDNYNCNRWAEDKWCPQETSLCLTAHHFSHGRSKSVTKRCAARHDCQAVGCRHHRDTGHMECVSCCEGMVCNVDVPTNHSNAILALRHTSSSLGHSVRPWVGPILLAWIALVLGLC